MNLTHELMDATYVVRETAAQIALRWGQDHQISADRLTHLVNDLRSMDLERILR